MSQVERYGSPLPDEIPLEVRGDWLRVGRLVRVFAVSKACPPGYRDDPEGIFAALWLAHTLGLAVNINVLRKFHNFDGVIVPAAQTLLGLLHAAGHHTRWGRHDNELAEVFVRQRGDTEEERFDFTTERAREAHLLDEWVVRWVGTGERWPDSGKEKMKQDKYIIGSTTAEYVPDWVQPEIDAGNVKRRDSWFSYREDMLMNRAASRAVKFVAPEIELGLDRASATPAPPTIRPQAALEVMPPPGEATEATLFDPDPTRPFE